MSQIARADQIGSLVRPDALLDARDAFVAGALSRAGLTEAEDRAILETLASQRRAGIDVYSDGEFRRDAYQTGISQAVDGFAEDYPIREYRHPDGTVVKVEQHAKAVSGKLRQVRRIAGAEARFLKDHAPGPFKITLTSPACIARRNFERGVTDKAYPDPRALLSDLVGIMAAEMKALVEDGVTYIQLDQGFAEYVRDAWIETVEAEGGDLERMIEADIAAENACYDAARGDGVTLAMHACRGNRVSFRYAQGSYDWLAERLFDRLRVDRFLLEYDSDRAGGFEPLRFLPKGKVAVLGLVSSKDPELEPQEELLRRLDEAAKYCSADQLALSAQCGFQGAANRDGAHMTVDQQERKLALIAETARRFWQ